MKNTYIKYIAIAVCGILAACTHDKNDVNQPERIPVGFHSGIATRAADGQWQNNDRIGIFMVEAGQQLNEQTISLGADNRQYITSEGVSSELTPASENDAIYFPVDGAVDFIAYHPYMPSNDISDYMIPLDISDQIVELAQDLLYSNNAKARTKDNPQVELTFGHALSRIVVNTTLADEFEGQTINDLWFAGFDNNGLFSLATGEWLPGGTGTIEPYKDGDTFIAHMIPQNAAAGRMIAIKIGGNVVTYLIAEDMPFTAGMSYTFNLLVGRNGIQDVTVTIDEWHTAQLPDDTISALSGDQIEIVWNLYNDENFTGIEILTIDGKTYASQVEPNADQTASKTTGLILADVKTIDVEKVWVYYMGRKYEVGSGMIGVEDGIIYFLGFNNIIAKREHLEYIGSAPEPLANNYTQVCDIDLGGSASPWTPIGDKQFPFTGTYDGGGYKIENIYVDISANADDGKNYGGIFGYSTNGVFRNINLASGSVTGNDFIGGICGYITADDGSSCEIVNCVNYADITGRQHIGGICGYNENIGNKSQISQCVNYGNVSGTMWIGGINGRINTSQNGSSEIICCYNEGDITGTSYYIGGICAWHYAFDNANASITACYNTGTITGGQTLGGVCGLNWQKDNCTARLTECYNAAPVTGTKDYGGICGTNTLGDVLYCFWTTWGTGAATSAVGKNSGLIRCYKFSGTIWPGITSTPGYWLLYSDGGYWKSFGAWGGSAENSIYPVLAGLP